MGSQDNTRYTDDISSIPEPARELLEQYSKISPEKAISHIVAVRNKAWDVHPYPCLGRFRFLELGISTSDAYGEVIRRLKDGQKLLDMGCCVGQDVRKLVYDGAPSENISACDLHQEFIDIGFDLFQDRDTLRSKFFTADVLDDNPFRDLHDHFDMVHAASFLHLFDLETQKKVARQIIALLRPVSGTMVLGRQVGGLSPYEKEREDGTTAYRHNDTSFRKMWDEVGAETGTKWKVAFTFGGSEGDLSRNPNDKRFRFVVTRQ